MEVAMRLVTGSEMQALDRATIDGGHVAALELMERAGRATAAQALAMLREAPGRVEILCGKGNNGGDGFVAARHLAAHGVAVRVHMTHAADALTPDARVQHDRLAEAGVEIHLLPEKIDDPGPISDPRQRRTT